ncbi:tetratricopeptide repeat protein [Larkinella soli]|uniref:tetratricopeptide repeat protein n=1 Tax=Larkinella soli TaxID=1770527 RepID=UPI000FFCBAC1|nr:tetratricopeptide repeat protein [Larkinella soli]
MEVVLLSLLFGIYLFIRYFVVDHETPAEKDRRRFQAGIDLIQLRRYEEAHAYFDSAVKAFPKSGLAYAYRGKCRLQLGNQHSALYDLTQALSLDNTVSSSYLDRGIAFFQLQLYQEAFREFDKAIWYSRGMEPDPLRWRAMVGIHLQRISQAEQDLRRAIELGDENSVYVLKQPPFTKVMLS